MEKCFICYCDLSSSVTYLPMIDEYFGQNISIFKNTFIVKNVDNFNFLYYYICNNCIDNYLKYYNKNFNYIRNREIGYN